MKADDAKRLEELERENGRLKAIVADQALENRALKEISRETGEPSPSASGGRDASRPPERQQALGMPRGWAASLDRALSTGPRRG
jgi:hypothetical protein